MIGLAEVLRVLLVEDSEDDAVLLVRYLKRGGQEVSYERVDTREAMQAALDGAQWDIVISDYNMPLFSAPAALSLLQESSLDLPFIIVSGAIGEEVAVNAMKAGAHDYIMKDNLARLIPAVERELREAERRRQRRQAQEALRVSEETNKKLFEQHAILARIGRIISSSLDINEVYERFAAEVRKLVSFSRITIADIDLRVGTATTAYSMGVEIRPSDKGFQVFLTGTAIEDIVLSRSSRVFDLSDVNRLQTVCPDLEQCYNAGTRSFLVTPLLSKDEIIGALVLESVNPNCYTDQDVSMAEGVAAQIAGAIANSRLYADRESLQEQLLQSQKMEAVGKLAGGIAHDFNNLLTPIMGYTQMAINNESLQDRVREHLQKVHVAADRASRLVRQLLVFSRQEIIEPIEINLNQLIQEVEEIIHRLIGEDVELVIRAASDLGLVKTDPTQIEQILVNLTVNACDAMPEGGKFSIKTDNVHIGPDQVRQYSGLVAGEYIMLTVGDTGVGMSEEVKARIFEPFFTTKGVGKGTGLGLSTCYGIVSRHGGCITVDSAPGQGTTFRIYLPRAEEPPSPESSEDELASNPLAASETILLAEDESMVREVTACVLREHGYVVLEACDGEDGLRMAREQAGSPIHLLLTDVIMPQMNGRELAKQVTALYPETAVIYMSGYTDDILTSSDVGVSTEVFMQKPFSLEVLLQKVRAALDGQ